MVQHCSPRQYFIMFLVQGKKELLALCKNMWLTQEEFLMFYVVSCC